MIEQRSLGASDHRSGATGLGAVDVGSIDDEAAYRLMDHALGRAITFLQPEYNLKAPEGADSMVPAGLSELQDQLLPLAEREQITVTTYSPLGSGSLTGKSARERTVLPDTRFSEGVPAAEHFLTEQNFKILELDPELRAELSAWARAA